MNEQETQVAVPVVDKVKKSRPRKVLTKSAYIKELLLQNLDRNAIVMEVLAKFPEADKDKVSKIVSVRKSNLKKEGLLK